MNTLERLRRWLTGEVTLTLTEVETLRRELAATARDQGVTLSNWWQFDSDEEAGGIYRRAGNKLVAEHGLVWLREQFPDDNQYLRAIRRAGHRLVRLQWGGRSYVYVPTSLLAQLRGRSRRGRYGPEAKSVTNLAAIAQLDWSTTRLNYLHQIADLLSDSQVEAVTDLVDVLRAQISDSLPEFDERQWVAFAYLYAGGGQRAMTLLHALKALTEGEQ